MATANAPRAELVDAHGLLASLLWHQIRPHGRATREGRLRIDYPKASAGMIGVAAA